VRDWPQNGYADQTAEIGRRLNRFFRFHGPMEADASTVWADGWITNRRRSFDNAIVSRRPILWSRGVMLPKMRLMDGLPARGRHLALACTQSVSGSCSLWSARVLGVLLGRGADRRCRRPIEKPNGQRCRD
jgi:endonuclease/exonuclease/phosphatase family metal-dependent hydrolase